MSTNILYSLNHLYNRVEIFLFLLIIIILIDNSILLSKALLYENKEQRFCLLASVDETNSPTICNYKKSLKDNLPFRMDLLDCKSTSTRESFSLCGELIDQNICLLNIELTNLFQYKDLFTNGYSNYCYQNNEIIGHEHRDRLHINLTITSSIGAPKDMKKWKLFENIQDYEIDYLNLKTITINKYNQIFYLIRMNEFIKYICITESNLEYNHSTRTTTNQSTALFSTRTLKNLEKVSIKDSKFYFIGYKNFYIDTKNRLKEIELINIELEEKITSEAFVVICEADDNNDNGDEEHNNRKDLLQIKLENIKTLNRKSNFPIEGEFLSLSQCTKENLKLNLTFAGKSFEQNFIPQPVFEKVLKDLYLNSWTNFKYEPIDCCYDRNKWLFELQANLSSNFQENLKKIRTRLLGLNNDELKEGEQFNHYKQSAEGNGTNSDKRNSTYMDILCTDLRNTVNDYSYSNITVLIDACNQRNVYPIFEIAIVCIFLLAIFLGVFSVICFFYVLPRKDDVITINNNLKHRAISNISSIKNKSSANKQVNSSDSATNQQKLATTRTAIGLNKIYNPNNLIMKTAYTDDAKNQQPLMSTDTRLLVDSKDKQQQLEQKSPIAKKSPSPIKLTIKDTSKGEVKLTRRKSNDTQSPNSPKRSSPKQVSAIKKSSTKSPTAKKSPKPSSSPSTPSSPNRRRTFKSLLTKSTS